MGILELQHIGLRYGPETPIFREVSYGFAPGSFHFLTGPSGAGKSSLLRLCYLAERPSEGRVRLYGEDVAALSRTARAKLRRRIGVVFQDFRLIPHLTAAENVALPLRVAGRAGPEASAQARELLAWSGMAAQADAYPASLSGGQQQRVAIARAVIRRPGLLLADEPTGNIDEASAERVMRLFIELNRMGTTVVMATHDRALIAAHAFPCLRLHNGALQVEAQEAA